MGDTLFGTLFILLSHFLFQKKLNQPVLGIYPFTTKKTSILQIIKLYKIASFCLCSISQGKTIWFEKMHQRTRAIGYI